MHIVPQWRPSLLPSSSAQGLLHKMIKLTNAKREIRKNRHTFTHYTGWELRARPDCWEFRIAPKSRVRKGIACVRKKFDWTEWSKKPQLESKTQSPLLFDSEIFILSSRNNLPQPTQVHRTFLPLRGLLQDEAPHLRRPSFQLNQKIPCCRLTSQHLEILACRRLISTRTTTASTTGLHLAIFQNRFKLEFQQFIFRNQMTRPSYRPHNKPQWFWLPPFELYLFVIDRVPSCDFARRLIESVG